MHRLRPAAATSSQKHDAHRLRRSLSRGLAATAALAMLSGCSTGFSNLSGPSAGTALSGSVLGGQQPVSGAKIYLYAVGSTGYSSPATSQLAPT